jgi:hypothetical protein
MNLPTAVLGIAGVNTHPLSSAVLGIAGNLSLALRGDIAEQMQTVGSLRKTLGDRAARKGWQRTCYLLDYTYPMCTARAGGMRWSKGFRRFYGREQRLIPVVFDSTGFRRYMGSAPAWASYRSYLEAIDVAEPDAVMAYDVMGDQEASRRNYERMCSDGYRDLTIPVWQAPAVWDPTATPADNGRRAAQDAVLRFYAAQSPLVAIGGLLARPAGSKRNSSKRLIPVRARAEYLTAIAEGLPGVRLWGLGQASGTVVNGLGARGMLETISVDGQWYIQAGKCQQLAYLDKELGLLRADTYAHSGRETFLTYTEIMALNLRALKAAYDGLWAFPGPSRVPTNFADADERAEFKRRAKAELQTSFLDLL